MNGIGAAPRFNGGAGPAYWPKPPGGGGVKGAECQVLPIAGPGGGVLRAPNARSCLLLVKQLGLLLKRLRSRSLRF
jgi:hypothetical protein